MRVMIADDTQQPCSTLHKAIGALRRRIGEGSSLALFKDLNMLNHAYTAIHHLDKVGLYCTAMEVGAILEKCGVLSQLEDEAAVVPDGRGAAMDVDFRGGDHGEEGQGSFSSIPAGGSWGLLAYGLPESEGIGSKAKKRVAEPALQPCSNVPQQLPLPSAAAADGGALGPDVLGAVEKW